MKMRFLFLAFIAASLNNCAEQSDYDDETHNAAAAVDDDTSNMQADDAPIDGPNVAPSPTRNSPTEPSGLPAGSVRVQPAKIMDNNGFEKPIRAATMMIPVGWKTQGGIVWTQNMAGCGPTTPHLNWTATAADGLSSIQMLPEEIWTGHNMQFPGMPQSQCPNVAITDPRAYITQYVNRVRPGARHLDYRERADIIEGVNKMLPPMQPDMYGMETRRWVGAGDVLLGYTKQGREMRELIGVVAVFTLTRMSDGLGGVTETLMTFSVPSFSYSAPEGQLDFDKAAMIRNSYRSDPQWSARMAQYHANIARINAKGAADRARITAQTNREISDMQMESWRNQQESSDRNSREFSEYIRGVETYNDPINGGTVQLDSTYDNAWQLDDGTYVLTNDLSFNPYAATGQDGQQLEPTQ